MQLGISEILSKISKEQDPVRRESMLAAQIKNNGVIQILRLAYDHTLVFNLPEGDPPYKPCDYLDQQSMLYNSLKTMYLYINEGNPKVPTAKKEKLFINMLESLDPEDAKLLLAVKAKRLPYDNITEELVRKIFPNLLPPPPVTEKKKSRKA